MERWQVTDCPEIPAFVSSTSGTTAQARFFYLSREAYENSAKRFVKALKSLNLKPKNVLLNLAGKDRTALWQGVLGVRLANLIPIIGPLPQSNNIDRILFLIKKFKPVAIFISTDSLWELFSQVNEKVSVNKIMYMGAPLPEKAKQIIKQKTGAKFLSVYGCEEVGMIGLKEENKIFFNLFDQPGLYIEVLNSKGEAKEYGEGEIVITDLCNFSTPIIRYRLGDKVKIFRRGSKKLLALFGRADKYTKVMGNVTSIGYLINTVKQILGHPKFSIVLTKTEPGIEDEIKLVLPTTEKKDIKKLNQIRKVFKTNFRAKVNLVFSDKAIPLRTGKYQNFIDLRK